MQECESLSLSHGFWIRDEPPRFFHVMCEEYRLKRHPFNFDLTHSHSHTCTLCDTWRSHMSPCGALFFPTHATSSGTSVRENKNTILMNLNQINQF